MKDRSFTLLALLSANDRLAGQAVYRTVIVKQVFLAETIRPIYKIWCQMFRFYRYNHGPFSDDIFERMDTLIFSGLVEVESYRRQSGRTEARYRITPSGHQILEEVGNAEITSLAYDLVWALQSLGVEQAGTICKLVYQESEFARIFENHNKHGIGPETKVGLPSITKSNNESFTTLAVLQEFHRSNSSGFLPASLPPRELVRMFLLSLAMQVPQVIQSYEARK